MIAHGMISRPGHLSCTPRDFHFSRTRFVISQCPAFIATQQDEAFLPYLSKWSQACSCAPTTPYFRYPNILLIGGIRNSPNATWTFLFIQSCQLTQGYLGLQTRNMDSSCLQSCAPFLSFPGTKPKISVLGSGEKASTGELKHELQ